MRESLDGGTTWHMRQRLLEGNAIYLWRARRLLGNMIIVMASLYGTAWSLGNERATHNTMLPDERYLDKVQAFFLASTDDGETFSGPHYILPGTGALLFIAGDVQATPVARQRVRHEEGRFINEPLRPIKRDRCRLRSMRPVRKRRQPMRTACCRLAAGQAMMEGDWYI